MARRRNPQNRLRQDTVRPMTGGVQEAIDLAPGEVIDSDDGLWRSLTGQRSDNLPDFQQERSIKIAKYLFRSNPAGNRLLTLLSDFVLGEGVSLSFRNSDVEQVVMRHWDDPYNDWDLAMSDYFENYLLFGELLMPLFPNQTDGHLRIGLQLAENIKSVQSDPENWRVPRTVTMSKRVGEDTERRYRVVNVRESRDELEDSEGVASPPALLFTRGNPFGNRGISILYAIADLLDLLEQFMYSEVERSFLLKAFVFVVTMHGATQEEINAAIKTGRFAPPKPGTVVVKNEKEDWDVSNPQLNTADAWNGLRSLRNHLTGSVGIPEHWFSEGGDVNRATASEMSAPPLKRLTRLQNDWRAVLNAVIRAQIDYAILKGTLKEMVPIEKDGQETKDLIPAHEAYTLSMPDLSPSDNKEVVETLSTLTSTLMLAEDAEYMSKRTARTIFLTLVQQLGVEIDIAEEETAILKDEEDCAEDMADVPQVQTPPIALVQRQEERAAAAAAGGGV
jgi:hypothetical protein